VGILRGGLVDRIKTLTETMNPEDDLESAVVILSYGAAVSDEQILSAIPWDMAILDESHSIKNPRTKRWKTFRQLRTHCKQKILLTGTPITNSVLDLFCQLEFLGEGMSGFVSEKRFNTYYQRFTTDAQGQQHKTGYENLPIMQERLTRIAFRVTKAEVLKDLPSKVYSVLECQMGPRQTEVYNLVRDRILAEIECMMAAGQSEQLLVENSLTRLLRLAQITAGFVTWDAKVAGDGSVVNPKHTEFFAENPKLETLLEKLGDTLQDPYEKAIVWSCFVPAIKRISERLSLEGIGHETFIGTMTEKQRVNAETQFNENPLCRVLVANPACAGQGLNLVGYDWASTPPLQRTNTAEQIYFVQNWSCLQRAQSEDRAHRDGTRTQVRTLDLVVPDTIDEVIRERVVSKIVQARTIQDVRDVMRSLLTQRITRGRESNE